MKYGRAHLCEAVGGSLRARALADDEGVRDVRRVVDAEADADHEEDAHEGVDGLQEEVLDEEVKVMCKNHLGFRILFTFFIKEELVKSVMIARA